MKRVSGRSEEDMAFWLKPDPKVDRVRRGKGFYHVVEGRDRRGEQRGWRPSGRIPS